MSLSRKLRYERAITSSRPSPTLLLEPPLLLLTIEQQRVLQDILSSPFNGEESGERATVNVCVGIDKPDVPSVRVIDQTTSAKITWQPVKGANGGVILPSEVRYDIYNVTDAGAVGEKIGSVQGGTEYVVSGLQNNEGVQDYKQWAVNANTSMGSSLYGVGAIVVGAPYLLPFHNSFKDLTLEASSLPSNVLTRKLLGILLTTRRLTTMVEPLHSVLKTRHRCHCYRKDKPARCYFAEASF